MVTVQETLIDVPGVAQKFHVSTRTVYRWMKSGLEYGKWGGRVLTSLEALQRFSQQGFDEDAAILKDLRDRYGVDLGKGADTDGKAKERDLSQLPGKTFQPGTVQRLPHRRSSADRVRAKD
jgi:hypothetical protein